MKAEQYKLTAGDTEQIKALGFKIHNDGRGAEFHEFINFAYPNFNITAFLQYLIATFSTISGKPLLKTIRYNLETLKLDIEVLSRDEKLGFVRYFAHQDGMKIVEHAYLELPSPFQQKGIAQNILRESMQQYINMNLTRIDLFAALGGGGYAWAKYGFVAIKKSEIDIIFEEAKRQLSEGQFSAVKRIYTGYYSGDPDGRAFPVILWANMPFMKPVLTGAQWHGELYLNNPEQFNNFMLYVSR